MIKSPITMILGAGASVAYGYPTGAGLIRQIVQLLEWNVYVSPSHSLPLGFTKLSSHEREFGDFHRNIAEFCFAVRRSNPTNIDSFLRDNPSLEKLGRTIIAYIIRISEYNDYGHIVPPQNSFNPWYHVLFDNMVSRADPKDIASNQKLKIVTFNYDVSLEYFLASSLINNERTAPFAKQIFDSIPIVHMFGSVGKVSIENDRVVYNYGDPSNSYQSGKKEIIQQVWNPSEHCGLHVAIETKHTHDEVRKNSQLAISYMESAERILCMGFDFTDYAHVYKKHTSAIEDTKLINRHIRPKLGHYLLREISRVEVAQFHKNLSHMPYGANRLRAVLSKMFSLAEEWGLREEGSNPTRYVKKYKESFRTRYLSQAELESLSDTLAAHQTKLKNPCHVTLKPQAQ